MPSTAPLPTPTKARSMLAVAVRLHDKEAELEARRLLAAANIEQFVKEAVAKAPPLTAQQRTRISALLNGGTQ